MEILWQYGLGNNLQRLLECFWEDQTVVARDGGCYGFLFNTDWGATQVEPVSPTTFNIVVGAVVRTTLM